MMSGWKQRFTACAAGAVFFLGGTVMQTYAENSAGKEQERSAVPETSVETLLEEFYALKEAGEPREFDTNEDGSNDYLARLNAEGKKMMEVMDFNHDGAVDDFYFYDNGILRKRAVDSNFDQMIDLWVYISGGVYISRYLQDTDYDGSFETRETFSPGRKEDGGKKRSDEAGSPADPLEALPSGEQAPAGEGDG
jgi:hypothetical protein